MPVPKPGQPSGRSLSAPSWLTGAGMSAKVTQVAAAVDATAAQARSASLASEALTRSVGVDDWSAKVNARRPYPVVLVHGTFSNPQLCWLTVAPALAAAGFNVFHLDYGAIADIPVLQGIGPIEESAQQLATFVDKVLDSTGANKVDIVGHSQGGMMPRYYLKFLGGAAKVNQLIALAPSNHGTTLDGLASLAQSYPGGKELLELLAPPAADQQIAGSKFLTTLNDGGDTVPGVRYTVIATKYDLTVTPYSSCWLDGDAVTNILLQDRYPADSVGHVGITFDPCALREVFDALEPAPVPGPRPQRSPAPATEPAR